MSGVLLALPIGYTLYTLYSTTRVGSTLADI